MLGLKLNHISKRGPSNIASIFLVWFSYLKYFFSDPPRTMNFLYPVLYEHNRCMYAISCANRLGSIISSKGVEFVTHLTTLHNDVIKMKHSPRCWPFVRGIHRSLVNSHRKGQYQGAWMFSLIYAWTNGWVNNRDAGDLRRYRAHYDVIVMDCIQHNTCIPNSNEALSTSMATNRQRILKRKTQRLRYGPGAGLTKPIPPIPLTFQFQNAGSISNITSIFDRCYRSSALTKVII